MAERAQLVLFEGPLSRKAMDLLVRRFERLGQQIDDRLVPPGATPQSRRGEATHGILLDDGGQDVAALLKRANERFRLGIVSDVSDGDREIGIARKARLCAGRHRQTTHER